MKRIKRNNLIIILTILEVLVLLLLFNTYINKHKYKITNEVRFKEQQIDHNTFALLVEQNGSYVESNQDTWPSSNDYKFNSELSGCIDLNGEAVEDVLSFEEGLMTLTTNKTVKCYVYFNEIPKFTIQFNTNGGNSMEDIIVTVDEVINIPTPTKTDTITIVNDTDATLSPNANSITRNYTFNGWTASNLNTSTAKYGTTTIPTEDWNGSTQVTGNYFIGLGSKDSIVTLTANWTSNSVTLPAVTKDGYNCGYTTSSIETTIEYQSGSSYTANNNTIYVYC